MKTRTLNISVITASLISTTAVANNDKNSLSLSTQPVPFATAVSPEFYDFSNNFPAPNVEDLQKNIPTTDEEWSAFVEPRDKVASQRALSLAKSLNVSIEQDSIAGVNVY